MKNPQIIPCSRTIFLFPGDYTDKESLYAAVIRLLDLPQDCGKNADALYDCLSGTDSVRMVLSGKIPEAIQADVKRICRVTADLGGEVIEK